MPVLKITNLKHSRHKGFTLHIPNLEMDERTIFAIVGTNGSGKTTLLESLASLHAETRNSIEVNGKILSSNLYDVRHNIGFIPDDENWLISGLTAREYFSLLAGIYSSAGRNKIDLLNNSKRLCKLLDLTRLDQQLSSLSHGNKKKVQIVAGVMHQPKVLLVDEPHNGLDPFAVKAMTKIILEARNAGACVVISTHDLVWAQKYADVISIMSNGSIRNQVNNPRSIKAKQKAKNETLSTVL